MKTIDASTRALLAQWIDQTFIQTEDWPKDSITTSDIQTAMDLSEKGYYLSISDWNEFLESLKIVGQNIKGYSDRIWKLAYR